MTNLNKFIDNSDGIRLAKVIEVDMSRGVKIQIEGEDEARETYYNSLIVPNVGDRVYFIEIGVTILIQGSLKF